MGGHFWVPNCNWSGSMTQREDTSGFQTVVAALALCENVNLSGFGKDLNVRHHSIRFGHEGILLMTLKESLFYNDLESDTIYENPFLYEASVYIPKVQIFH